MDLQELIAKKTSLEKELDEISIEIAKLKQTIRKGKVRKVCELLRELWEETDDAFEIMNDDEEYIYVDFEDIFRALETEFGI